MIEGIAEQVDGQLKDNAAALCSLHRTQRVEAARLNQLMSQECFEVSANYTLSFDCLLINAIIPRYDKIKIFTF